MWEEKFWGNVSSAVLDILNLRSPVDKSEWDIKSGVQNRGLGCRLEIYIYICI